MSPAPVTTQLSRVLPLQSEIAVQTVGAKHESMLRCVPISTWTNFSIKCPPIIISTTKTALTTASAECLLDFSFAITSLHSNHKGYATSILCIIQFWLLVLFYISSKKCPIDLEIDAQRFVEIGTFLKLAGLPPQPIYSWRGTTVGDHQIDNFFNVDGYWEVSQQDFTLLAVVVAGNQNLMHKSLQF
jgi:hypothetical protein